MRVGITFSAFDLLHAGHVAMLRESKQQCDYLVAGLQLDPTIDDLKINPQTIVQRYTPLKAVKYDEIIPLNRKRCGRYFEMDQIDVRILGEEYKDKDFNKDICVPE